MVGFFLDNIVIMNETIQMEPKDKVKQSGPRVPSNFCSFSVVFIIFQDPGDVIFHPRGEVSALAC